MPKRTIVIFSIFIIVTITGSIFIYFYRNFTKELVGRYVSKITICGNISDETDCYAKNFCEGIYGPSCPDCRDLEFRRCQRVPLKILIQIEQEKKLCQETLGEWYRNKLGNFCLCQKAGAGKVFDKTRGCVDNN